MVSQLKLHNHTRIENLFLPPRDIDTLNPPFGDPGFFLHHSHSGQALFFDLGDLHHLPVRKVVQASHIFISHGHIDHLIGFDHLLRATLNRPRHLHIYGPPGIIEMIGHKLQGYHWNLTTLYDLLISVHAVHEQHLKQCTFACRNKFHQEKITTSPRVDKTILTTPTFTINAVTLNHGTPCLAFTLNEPLQVKFQPEALNRHNWSPGPWLSQVHQGLQTAVAADTNIEIAGTNYTIKEVADAIATVKAGVKLAYVTDIGFTNDNLEKLIPLIGGADLLLCEAVFLNSTADKAKISHHLTASQAGAIANQAQVQQLKIFHFSRRHHGLEKEFYHQASEHFSGPIS